MVTKRSNCRTCGGGGGKKDLQVLHQSQSSLSSSSAQGVDSNGWMLFEYVGQPIQIRQIQSHKNRARKYRYGGNQGDMQRRILVHPEDVEMFANRPQDFKRADIKKDLEESAPVRMQVSEEPKLKIDRGFLAEPELAVELLKNFGLDNIAISSLRRDGYSTIERLRFASDAELLSIRGISDQRLKKMKSALSAFLKAA